MRSDFLTRTPGPSGWRSVASSIDRLYAALQIEEAGEEIAARIGELLVDDRGRNVLLAKLVEAGNERALLRQEVQLTRLEAEVRRIVTESGQPATAEDVAKYAPGNYKSLRHRSNASMALNSLVEKGILGKVHVGQQVYFTDAEEAVMEGMKRLGMSPRNFDPEAIARTTGVPSGIVTDAILRLSQG